MCARVCVVGRQEGERRRVLLCHHGNTSPTLPWSPLQPNPKPADENARSGKFSSRTRRTSFLPPTKLRLTYFCFDALAEISFSVFVWREDVNIDKILNTRNIIWKKKETTRRLIQKKKKIVRKACSSVSSVG